MFSPLLIKEFLDFCHGLESLDISFSCKYLTCGFLGVFFLKDLVSIFALGSVFFKGLTIKIVIIGLLTALSQIMSAQNVILSSSDFRLGGIINAFIFSLFSYLRNFLLLFLIFIFILVHQVIKLIIQILPLLSRTTNTFLLNSRCTAYYKCYQTIFHFIKIII